MDNIRITIPDSVILDAPDPIHPADFPEVTNCPVSCNSWIIYHPNGMFETFDRKIAFEAFSKGIEVKTAYEHLASLS